VKVKQEMLRMSTFKWNDYVKGSATIEAAFIVPLILFLCMSIIFTVFYYHDKNVLIAVASETAIMAASNDKGYRQLSDEDFIGFFNERIENKLIFFEDPDVTIEQTGKYYEVTGSTSRLRFRYTFRQRARIFNAEELIRKKQTIVDIVTPDN